MAAAFAVLIKARKKREQQRESAAVMNGGSSNDGAVAAAWRPSGWMHKGLQRTVRRPARICFRGRNSRCGCTTPMQFNFSSLASSSSISLPLSLKRRSDPYSADSGLQQYSHVWTTIDDICNVIFLIELILNLYGSWWRPFLRSGWNYLDTIVVVVGITSLARVPLGPLAQIKIIRAFRILRLFKRVDSLNQILIALVRSIPRGLQRLPRHAHRHDDLRHRRR